MRQVWTIRYLTSIFKVSFDFFLHGAIGCGQKSCTLVWRNHRSCSGSLPKTTCLESHVSHVCWIMIRMTGFAQICISLTAEENPGKPQLGDRLMKAVRAVIASNGSLTSKWGRLDRTARQEGRRKEGDFDFLPFNAEF